MEFCHDHAFADTAKPRETTVIWGTEELDADCAYLVFFQSADWKAEVTDADDSHALPFGLCRGVFAG